MVSLTISRPGVSISAKIFGQAISCFKKAIELKTGARGLRTILEERMLDVMYSCHFEENIKRITITEDFINKKENQKIEKFEKSKSKQKTA